MSERKDSPGIRIIPPVVYLIGFLAGYGLEQFWPLAEAAWPWANLGGGLLIGVSVLLAAPSILRFRKAATPFDVRKPATALVTEGPYRYSRNPGYLALTLLYLGGVLLSESLWALALLVPVLVIMIHGVVKQEEAHLEALFGDEYREYKSQVRRWL